MSKWNRAQVVCNANTRSGILMIGDKYPQKVHAIEQGYQNQFIGYTEFYEKFDDTQMSICTNISMLLTSISRSHPFGEK